MRSPPVLALALLLASPCRAAEAGPAMPLALTAGHSQTIRVDAAVRRIVVRDAGILAIDAITARSFRITGIAPGETLVSFLDASGTALASHVIRVSAKDSVLRHKLMAEPGLQHLHAEQSGDTIVLTGEIPDREHHEKARALVNAWGKGQVADLTTVTGRQMVAVDVQFAAVATGTLKALGFSFAKLGGGIQGALAAPNTLNAVSLPNTASGAPFDIDASTPIQSAFNLFLSNPAHGITGVLSALASTGLSEVLAQPTLLVRSGDEASFLAGGEVPVPVPQSGNAGNSIGISYREFGVRLNVTADVLSNRRIVLKLTPEVSELDYANGVRMQGYVVPGIRRRSATTTVQLGSGQSFVIAGLNYSTTSITTEKLPVLADLPVLGALFRRTQKEHQQQELVIIATPRLVDPLPAGQPAPLPPGISSPMSDFGLMRR